MIKEQNRYLRRIEPKKKSWFTRKKGDPTDIIVGVIIMFFLGIGFLTMAFIVDEVSDAFEGTIINNPQTTDSIQKFRTIGQVTLGQLYMMALFASILGIMVTSFLVRLHPAFIFIYIFTLGAALVLAGVLGNTYGELIEIEPFAAQAAAQPIINFIMSNSVIINLLVGALSMIIIFSKSFPVPGEPGGGGI